jgi:hypothetical protein
MHMIHMMNHIDIDDENINDNKYCLLDLKINHLHNYNY